MFKASPSENDGRDPRWPSAIRPPLSWGQPRQTGPAWWKNSAVPWQCTAVGKYLSGMRLPATGEWSLACMRRIDGKNRYPIDVVKIPLSDR